MAEAIVVMCLTGYLLYRAKATATSVPSPIWLYMLSSLIIFVAVYSIGTSQAQWMARSVLLLSHISLVHILVPFLFAFIQLCVCEATMPPPIDPIPEKDGDMRKRQRL